MNNKLLLSLLFLIGVYFRASSLLDFPPSLYWEEVALGYDAYSILQTGKDHHGTVLPLVAFESFGDWKPSLYFYYLVPFIGILGLGDLAVRVAAVMVGLLFLLAIPFLAKELKISPALVLAVAAISPWAIHFSRSAWEAYLASTLIIWAVVFGLKAGRIHKLIWLLISALLFALSMYTYHAARVIAPLLFVMLLIFNLPIPYRTLSVKKVMQAIKQLWKKYLIACCFFIILIMPLIVAVVAQDISITHRYQETNIFSDISIIEKSNELKNLSNNSMLSRLLYHRYVLFGEVIVKNICSYFDLNYLFLTGDENIRHSTGYTGILYPIELLFLIAGSYRFIRKSLKSLFLLSFWLVVTLLPASVSIPNPHALRTIIALPVYVLLVAAGISVVFHSVYVYISSFQQFKIVVKKFGEVFAKQLLKIILMVTLVSIYLVQIATFWRYYSIIYARQSSTEWQYGYAQLISALQNISEDRIVYVSRTIGRPAMYYWFYSKTNPIVVQTENKIALKDQSEFLTFKNVRFFRNIGDITFLDNSVVAVPSQEFTLLVDKAEQSGFSLNEISVVHDLDGKVIWNVVTINQ